MTIEHRVFSSERAQELLSLPENKFVGRAIANGGCFFDALAQALNQLHVSTEYSEKSLRQACHQFYIENQALVLGWILSDMGSRPENLDTSAIEQIKQDYYFIQYTAPELEANFHGRPPIWGRGYVEGRMLCRALGLVGFRIIEIVNDSGSDQQIVLHSIVTADDVKQIDADAHPLGEIPTLVVDQTHMHFAPILNKVEQTFDDISTLIGDVPMIPDYGVVREKLSRNINSLLLRYRIVILSGIGGLGKTSLALQYLWPGCVPGQKSYKYRFFIKANNSNDITESYLLFLEHLEFNEEIKSFSGAPQEKAQKIKQFFDKMLCLIIFDDLDDELSEVDQWIPENSDILVTTRRRDLVLPEQASFYRVPFMEKEEAQMLLVKALYGPGDIPINEKLALDELSGILGYFPLALTQAASYIKLQRKEGRKLTVQQYIKEIQDQLIKRDLIKMTELSFNPHGVMAGTWDVSFAKIKQCDGGKIAIRLLTYISYLSAEGLPLDVLKLVLKEDVLEPYLQLLEKYSFLVRKEDKISITHYLVQEVLQLQIDNKKKQKHLLKLLSCFLEALSVMRRSPSISETQFGFMWPHVKAIFRFCQECFRQSHPHGQDLVLLLRGMADVCEGIAPADLSISFLKFAKKQGALIYKLDHADLRSMIIQLIEVYVKRANTIKVVKLLRKIVSPTAEERMKLGKILISLRDAIPIDLQQKFFVLGTDGSTATVVESTPGGRTNAHFSAVGAVLKDSVISGATIFAPSISVEGSSSINVGSIIGEVHIHQMPYLTNIKYIGKPPFWRPEFHVNREPLLRTLRSFLSNSQENGNIVICCGLAGIGKTHFALQYYYSNFGSEVDPYKYRIFLDGSSSEQMMDGYRLLLSTLGLESRQENIEIQASMTRIWLENNSGWLLIVDNVGFSGFYDIVSLIPKRGGDVILITRHRPQDHSLNKTLCIGIMSMEESLELIQTIVGAYARGQYNRSDFISLAKILGGLPSALVNAVVDMMRARLSPQDFLQRVESQKLSFFADQRSTILSRYKSELEQFKARGILASYLLDCMAYLSSEKIFVGALKLVVSQEQEGVDQERQAVQFGQALELLRDYLLTDWVSSSSGEIFSLHPLFQLGIRETHDAEKSAIILGRLIKAFFFTHVWNKKNSRDFHKVINYRAHVKKLMDFVNRGQEALLLQLLKILSDSEEWIGSHEERQRLYQEMMRIAEAFGVGEELESEKIIVNWCNFEDNISFSDKDKKLQKAISTFEESHPEGFDISRVLVSIAIESGKKGDLQKKLSLLEGLYKKFWEEESSAPLMLKIKILLNYDSVLLEYFGSHDKGFEKKILEASLKACQNSGYALSHPEVLKMLLHFSVRLYQSQKVEQARRIIAFILSRLEVFYYSNPDHPNIIFIPFILGSMVGGQEESIQDQKILLQIALAKFEQKYGKNSLEVGKALLSLANMASRDNSEAGRVLAFKALEIFLLKHQGGVYHPDIGRCYLHLGGSGQDFRVPALEERKQHLERAMDIFRSTLAKTHPDIGRTYANLGEVYGKLGRGSRKKELLEKARDIFTMHGLHVETVKVCIKLASVYIDLKKQAWAIHFLLQALAEIVKVCDNNRGMQQILFECGPHASQGNTEIGVLKEKLLGLVTILSQDYLIDCEEIETVMDALEAQAPDIEDCSNKAINFQELLNRWGKWWASARQGHFNGVYYRGDCPTFSCSCIGSHRLSAAHQLTFQPVATNVSLLSESSSRFARLSAQVLLSEASVTNATNRSIRKAFQQTHSLRNVGSIEFDRTLQIERPLLFTFNIRMDDKAWTQDILGMQRALITSQEESSHFCEYVVSPYSHTKLEVFSNEVPFQAKFTQEILISGFVMVYCQNKIRNEASSKGLHKKWLVPIRAVIEDLKANSGEFLMGHQGVLDCFEVRGDTVCFRSDGSIQMMVMDNNIKITSWPMSASEIEIVPSGSEDFPVEVLRPVITPQKRPSLTAARLDTTISDSLVMRESDEFHSLLANAEGDAQRRSLQEPLAPNALGMLAMLGRHNQSYEQLLMRDWDEFYNILSQETSKYRGGAPVPAPVSEEALLVSGVEMHISAKPSAEFAGTEAAGVGVLDDEAPQASMGDAPLAEPPPLVLPNPSSTLRFRVTVYNGAFFSNPYLGIDFYDNFQLGGEPEFYPEPDVSRHSDIGGGR